MGTSGLRREPSELGAAVTMSGDRQSVQSQTPFATRGAARSGRGSFCTWGIKRCWSVEEANGRKLEGVVKTRGQIV